MGYQPIIKNIKRVVRYYILGVKLGKCNQAEMYGEHIEFDTLRFHYFACHMTSALNRCFKGIFVVFADS